MTFNKHQLEEGQTVMLDANYHNRSHVIIKALSSRGMFALIHTGDNLDNVWQVMTARLSPLTTSKTEK